MDKRRDKTHRISPTFGWPPTTLVNSFSSSSPRARHCSTNPSSSMIFNTSFAARAPIAQDWKVYPFVKAPEPDSNAEMMRAEQRTAAHGA